MVSIQVHEDLMDLQYLLTSTCGSAGLPRMMQQTLLMQLIDCKVNDTLNSTGLVVMKWNFKQAEHHNNAKLRDLAIYNKKNQKYG